MSENQETQETQEEILANFQSITGIDDVAEAIFYLEESSWDLLAAVNRVLPQEHVEPSPYNAESLNNLNIAGSSSNENRLPASPSTLMHRNIFGSEMLASSSNANEYNLQQNLDDESMGDGHNDQTNGECSVAQCSTASTPKDIKFNIHHKYTTHNIVVSDRSTIDDLKARIFDVTSIPKCRQSWCGWVQSSENYDDSTALRTMNLSDENELIVNDIKDRYNDIGIVSDDADVERLTRTFKLNILLGNTLNTVPLQLNFPGTRSIGDVKKDVYSVTNIAVRHQQWHGWPSDVSDDTALALTGIPYDHNLVLHSTEATSTTTTTTTPTPAAAAGDGATSAVATVGSSSSSSTITTTTSSSSSSSTSNQQQQTKTTNTTQQSDVLETNTRSNHNNELQPIEVDTDSSIDEFEDAASDFNGDDELFAAPAATRRHNDLIPDGTDNERWGCTQFIQNYRERYGEPYPNFYEGTLEEALNEACHKPAKDRKLLAIYLHHAKSVLVNVFCDRVMKNDTIRQTLEHNFVLYGWDLTNESNKNLFLSSLSACAGNSSASLPLRAMQTNRLPAILVICKYRSVCEVLSVIHGDVSIDDLLNKLMDAIKLYSEQRDVEVREEDERAARELVKMEQDAAYHESLEADRRKEEEKKQKERAIATERQRLESERQEIEMVREMNRLEAERAMPPEPAENADGITKIRIRKPTGDFLERRFLATDQLNTLLNFIASKGFPIDEYKVISSWPRRDLTMLEKRESLQHLKLCPQETVILEER